MPTFRVMNRSNAKRYCYQKHPDTSAIISISSWGDEQVQLFQTAQNRVKSILRITFNDVGADETGCMTREDAERIASFAKHIANRVDTIIVHCDAGVSRSAGTSAAIMKYLTGHDDQIFDNAFYKPNMYCYRLVIEAMYEN